MRPKLSIITVNFNNNSGLSKTLESVRHQSFSSYEHIIIDAGSKDGSLETIKQYAEGPACDILGVRTGQRDIRRNE